MKFDATKYDALLAGVQAPSLRQIREAVREAGGKCGPIKERILDVTDLRVSPPKPCKKVQQIMEVFDADDRLEIIPVEHLVIRDELR